MVEVKKIPKLRFPEFSKKWEKDDFSNIVERSNSKHNPITDDTIYQCIELESLSQETGILLETFDSNALKSIKNKFEKGEILFGKLRPYLKKYLMAPFDGVCSSEIWVFRGVKISNDFLFLLIQLPKFINATNISSGSKMPRADWDYISSTPFHFPTLPEQQKIASFLTSVDNKIQQLTRKKTLLEQYKKGVMQKIFSQEIRFKDDEGKEFPEWQTLKLNDFLKLTLRQVNKPKNNYLAIGIRSHCKGTFQKLDFDPEKIAMEKLFLVKENDLIVNITFAWEGAIALAKKEDDGGLVSHRFPTYTFNSEIVLYEYFRYVFIQKRFRLLLELISPGGAGRNRVMSKKDFLLLKTKIPIIEEQEKIAKFLTSIDKKIESVNTQLINTQAFKKGLLQQMFV